MDFHLRIDRRGEYIPTGDTADNGHGFLPLIHHIASSFVSADTVLFVKAVFLLQLKTAFKKTLLLNAVLILIKNGDADEGADRLQ